MKKLFALLFISGFVYGQETASVNLWSNPLGGLRNDITSQHISEHEFQDISNLFTDEEYGLVSCFGTDDVWLATGPVRFFDEYTQLDGDRYAILVDSYALNYATLPGIYTTLLDTITVNSVIWGVQYNNLYYIGDAEGDSWYFDGSDLTISTEIPAGTKYAEVEYNTLFCANTTRGGSVVEYSDIDDFNQFDDDKYLNIAKDDGEQISGICSFRGYVYVFKPHSTHKLLNVNNDDNGDDDSICISNVYGCSSNHGIVKINNLVFMPFQGGFIAFDGIDFHSISIPINGTIDSIRDMKSYMSSWLVDTQGDFDNGEFIFNASTVTSPGYVVLEVSTQPVNSAVSDFYTSDIDVGSNDIAHICAYSATAGAFYYSSWTYGVGWVYDDLSANITGKAHSIKLNSLDYPYIAADGGTAGYDLTFASWTGSAWVYTTVDAGAKVFNSVRGVDLAIDSNDNPHIAYIDTADTLNSYYIKYASWSSVNGWNTSTLTSEPCYRVQLELDSNDIPHLLYHSTYYYNNNAGYLHYSSCTSMSSWSDNITSVHIGTVALGSENYFDMVIDDNDVLHICHSKGIHQSFAYLYMTVSDTSTLTAGDTAIDSDLTTNGAGTMNSIAIYNNTPYVAFWSSDTKNLQYGYYNGSSWTTETLDSDTYSGNNPALAIDNRGAIHILYSKWAGVASDKGLLKYYTTRGEYVSERFNATAENAWQSWGRGTYNNVSDHCTVRGYERNGTTSAGLTGTAFTYSANNSIIPTQTGSFIQYCLSFHGSSTTATSSVDKTTIRYFLNGYPETMWGLPDTDNNRIWWNVTEWESNYSNVILIYQLENNAWTQLRGLNAYALGHFKYDIYLGNSDASGYIYRYSPDYTDFNGTSIAPYFKTKDFAFGYRNRDKKSGDLWTYFEPSTVYDEATIEYYINMSTSASISPEVDLTATSGYGDYPITKLSRYAVDRFRYINFKVSNFEIFYGFDFNVIIHPPGYR